MKKKVENNKIIIALVIFLLLVLIDSLKILFIPEIEFVTDILKNEIERVCQYSFVIFIHNYYDGAYLLELKKIIASSLIIVHVILLLHLIRTFGTILTL